MDTHGNSMLCLGTEMFVPVRMNMCPDDDGVSLSNCDFDMALGEFCEADSALPDGNSNYEINNCGNHDVFQYQCQEDCNLISNSSICFKTEEDLSPKAVKKEKTIWIA